MRADPAPFRVVVEKILIGEETLPEDWPVAGTTGYEFLNEALGLLVSPAGLEELAGVAERFVGRRQDYPAIVAAAKAEVLDRLFAGELAGLARRAAESEKQNMTPLLAGMPAYIGAVLAAGVTVASGGTLAGVAVAALLGGAGGGAVGAGAAGWFRGSVEETYARQLDQGGILLLVHPRSEDDVRHAQEVLARHADRQVETAPDRTLT